MITEKTAQTICKALSRKEAAEYCLHGIGKCTAQLYVVIPRSEKDGDEDCEVFDIGPGAFRDLLEGIIEYTSDCLDELNYLALQEAQG
jgi:hypothetical protein